MSHRSSAVQVPFFSQAPFLFNHRPMRVVGVLSNTAMGGFAMQWYSDNDVFWHQVGRFARISLVFIGLAGLGGLLFYVYAKPQVAPAWAREWLPGLPKYTPPLYRWRDEQGRVQVTDQPPQNRPFEEVQYRADANVVSPRRPNQ